MSYGGSFNGAIGGGGANTFTWPAPVTEAGYYKIYAFWMENQDRATDAPYTVHHAGGTTTVRVNQETNGQKWVPLGSFELAPGAGHKVVLSDDANEYVVADALRFVHESWEAVQPRSVVADAVRVVANSAEAPSYVHADHLGTPRKMTDQSGALAWDRVAMPVGETVSLTGTDTNPLRFPGQYFDTETGFHYNYFRDYDPSVGRYLQSDPIGLAGGLNTYAYVEGNPVMHVDPWGLFTSLVCRPLANPILGLFAKHCSVFVWDRAPCTGEIVNRRQFSVEFGGTEPLGQDTADNSTFDLDLDAFNNPGGPNEHYPISPPTGMTQQEFDDLVTRQGQRYREDSYDPLGQSGPNSNTAADNIIERAGGTVPDVDGAVGQNYGE